MHSMVRALGKVLRLVGISSPEDAEAKRTTEAGLPSWRRTAAQAESLQQKKQAEEKQAGE